MNLIDITSGDELLDLKYGFFSIDIIKEANRIPHAELVFPDGSGASPDFNLSNAEHFAPGKIIELKLPSDEEGSNKKTIFKGLVVKHRIEKNKEVGRLVIELRDPAFKLTKGRKSKVHQSPKGQVITDKEIIEKIIKDAQDTLGTQNAPLTVDMDETDTTVKHKELVQYYCTDWDFILSRADVNGQLVFTENGKLTIKKPLIEENSVTKGKKLSKTRDGKIYELEIEIDISEQYSETKSYAWNIETHQVESEAVLEPQKEVVKNPDKTVENIIKEKYMLSSIVSMAEHELKTWVNAKRTREKLSLLKGTIILDGRDISPGDVIDINEIADRLDGKTIVTAVRHKIDRDGWKTHIQFGLSADWFAQQNRDIIDVPAAGLLPAIQGLQLGIVEDYEKDPQNQFRVRVKIPALNPEGGGKEGIVWARLMAVDAGNRRGVYFYPEPGDEVVVDFFNNDPRQAVILGSMHSASKPPPFSTTENNWEKGIVTKKGVMVAFDDENIALKLGNKDDAGDEKQVVLIDQKEQKIMIADSINKNTMILGKKGIQISCEKDINIEAKGNVTIKGNIVDIN